MAQAQASQDAALHALGKRAPARERLRALIRQHFEVLLGSGSDFIPVMLYEWRSLTPEQREVVAAQKDPDKYRNLIVRIAGYSAYFVDLSPDLQNDLIARTAHGTMY